MYTFTKAKQTYIINLGVWLEGDSRPGQIAKVSIIFFHTLYSVMTVGQSEVKELTPDKSHQRVKQELSKLSSLSPNISAVPSDPTQLSWWLTANLPLEVTKQDQTSN